MSKTMFDLSTLPDIADGAHTVKVKAKAPAGYSGTIISTSWEAIYGIKSDGTEDILSIDDEGTRTVSGYVKYKIVYDYFNPSKHTVTTDKCTYEIFQTYGYMITPSSNDFTFTVKRNSNA